MKRFKMTQGRSFYLQVVMLTAVFIAVCVILTQTLASTLRIREKTETNYYALQLCRNAAEVFSECADADETAAILGGPEGKAEELLFNRELTPDAQGEYRMVLTQDERPTEAGKLVTLRVQVTDTDGQSEYASLTVEKYLPQN